MLPRKSIALIRTLVGIVQRVGWPTSSLVAAGTLLAILVVLAGFLLVKDLHDRAISDTERNLNGLTTLLAEQADRAIQAIGVIETGLAEELSNPQVARGRDFASRASSSGLSHQLAVSVAALPQLKSVVIVDAHGKLLNSSDSTPMPDQDAAGQAFLAALTRDPDMHGLLLDRGSASDGSRLGLIVAQRILDENGRLLGLTLGTLDLGYFERLYAEVSADEADVISIVHEDGTMIARHPCPPGTIGRKMPPLKWMRAPLAERPRAGVDYLTAPIDGRQRIIAARYMSHHPLIVGVSRTTEEALSPWREQVLVLGIAVCLLLAGLFLVLSAGSRQLRQQQLLARSEAARVAAEERALGERRLKEEHARFGTALDSMSQGLMLFGDDGRLVMMNTRLAGMFDVPPELRRVATPGGALLEHLSARMSNVDRALFVDGLIDSAMDAAKFPLTCGLADGRIVVVTKSVVPSGGVVCTFEDATERCRAENEISHMAHHDALTGLPNRLLLHTAARRLLSPTEAIRGGALLLLDLDGFKQVNDVYGHSFGDGLLQAVASRLVQEIDSADLLARLGGDEFAIVQFGRSVEKGDAQPVDALALASRVVAALSHPFVVEGVAVAVRTSIGIAVVDDMVSEPGVLLRSADIAMYRAKGAGGGTWCLYEPYMEQEILRRRDLEEDLRHALSEARLELHYQPIVRAACETISGYEALLRWRHPVRGMIPPTEFIPICEASGLIREIGRWVLEQACRDAVTWPENVKIAVNISPVQFRERELVEAVERALANSGLSAARLELEITESVLLQDDKSTLATLEMLHDLGVCIAMDDFGTGYASLSYLRRFPFDKVKIDQSFVRNLSKGSGDAVVLRAAIAFGKALGLTVLAEGIETAEERDLLASEGCDELQGYFFGRPTSMRKQVVHALEPV